MEEGEWDGTVNSGLVEAKIGDAVKI
jgi:hypothetical protein